MLPVRIINESLLTRLPANSRLQAPITCINACIFCLFVSLTFSCAIGVLVLRFNFQQYCTYWQKRTNRRGLKNATLLTDPYATVKSLRESGHATLPLPACLPCGSLTNHTAGSVEILLPTALTWLPSPTKLPVSLTMLE
jgi:hypothetical protein